MHFGAHFISGSLAFLINWITLHPNASYGVLFLGSSLETVVGPGFFIPGELFFLSGSILAGAHVLDIRMLVPLFYIGAAIGDSTSYWMGRALGASVFKEEKRILSLKNFHRVKRLFERHGAKAIFFARLIGPFPLIAPIFSGIVGVPYRTFLTYNIPGIIVGVGAFIAAGYFFGTHYQLLLDVLSRAFLVFAAVGIIGVFISLKVFKSADKAASLPGRTDSRTAAEIVSAAAFRAPLA